ncbi:adenosylmethionine decarboxylase [Amycolatopsis sp. CA-230715]|uniref:adenosylmethionine decarboxylase n=1 Tax=Amycolatopsis sp. CA-230715 TaxID=2745196 RepID=UPI001C009A40|nr:adenosylmethionine decarboxylase [Amycolatopsis sp. CA-230715]QWF77499.1 S-adenosylmethionine decarboxylase proenzyme [Amycolatopsis sp. CA-230715]
MKDEARTVGAFTGRHVLAELTDADPALLDDSGALREAMSSALSAAGATVCEVISHRFEPQGLTVLAMLAESHASIHTYPELGAAFVDVFTCGERADPELAVELLAKAVGAASVRSSTVHRGNGKDS